MFLNEQMASSGHSDRCQRPSCHRTKTSGRVVVDVASMHQALSLIKKKKKKAQWEKDQNADTS
jgi:hypothetical protein